MENSDSTPLIFMLKTLGDESRLAIFRLLCAGESTVGELATRINLKEPTVSHHLSRLREAGLVGLRMAGTQRYYHINANGINTFKSLMQTIDQIPGTPQADPSDDHWIAALGLSDEDQKVLHKYTENGKLKEIPVKQKKVLVILHWLATLFQPGKAYTENEVNAILKTVYEADYVSLRRYLIAFGFLQRETGGGKYWLAKESAVNKSTAK